MKSYFIFRQMFGEFSACTIIVQGENLEEAVAKIDKEKVRTSNALYDEFLIKNFNYFPKIDRTNSQWPEIETGVSGEEFIETSIDGWYDWMQFQANLPDGYEFYYSHSG